MWTGAVYLDAAATQGMPEILELPAQEEDEARAVEEDETDEHDDEPVLTIGCVLFCPETIAVTAFGELVGDDELDPVLQSSCKLQLPLR